MNLVDDVQPMCGFGLDPCSSADESYSVPPLRLEPANQAGTIDLHLKVVRTDMALPVVGRRERLDIVVREKGMRTAKVSDGGLEGAGEKDAHPVIQDELCVEPAACDALEAATRCYGLNRRSTVPTRIRRLH